VREKKDADNDVVDRSCIITLVLLLIRCCLSNYFKDQCVHRRSSIDPIRITIQHRSNALDSIVCCYWCLFSLGTLSSYVFRSWQTMLHDYCKSFTLACQLNNIFVNEMEENHRSSTNENNPTSMKHIHVTISRLIETEIVRIITIMTYRYFISLWHRLSSNRFVLVRSSVCRCDMSTRNWWFISWRENKLCFCLFTCYWIVRSTPFECNSRTYQWETRHEKIQVTNDSHTFVHWHDKQSTIFIRNEQVC
jgi:hypothetical protein